MFDCKVMMMIHNSVKIELNDIKCIGIRLQYFVLMFDYSFIELTQFIHCFKKLIHLS